MARTEILVEHTTDEMFEFKTAMIFGHQYTHWLSICTNLRCKESTICWVEFLSLVLT